MLDWVAGPVCRIDPPFGRPICKFKPRPPSVAEYPKKPDLNAPAEPGEVMGTATLTAPEQVTDTFPINGTDFIEFYVGNAKQAAQFYRNVFGYRIVAYRGPETGTRDRASYVLTQGKVRLVLTTALRPDSDIAAHVHKHGDGVKDIALWVDDARKAFRLAVERGAKPVSEPKSLVDEQGEVVIAGIRTYGETVHSLVERRNYKGEFMPGFVPFTGRGDAEGVGLMYIDHCVG